MQPSQIRGVIVRARRLVVSVARLVLRELDRWKQTICQTAQVGVRSEAPVGKAGHFRSTPRSGPSRSRFGLRIRADSVANLLKCRSINFPQIDQTSPQSPIDVASRSLPKSPVSSSPLFDRRV